ncbi:MAG: hypothetical protein IJW19_04810 [Clostridia bacterium]|nr:hypothetical protein [Clostridia bacterium]
MKKYDDNYIDETEENDSSPKKKKRFNVFDWYYAREGKGVDEDGFVALDKPTLKNFFKLLWRKLGKLMSCNLFFVFSNFPLAFLIISMAGLLTTQSIHPYHQSALTLNGLSLFESDGAIMTFNSLYGTQINITAINTPTIVFFCLGFLTIFTWGFSKVGTTYIYRNLMKGEAVFPFSDAMYVIKRNIKQSLIFGIIDFIFIAMFIYNISFLLANYTISSMNSFMFFFTLVMCVLYFFMRPYIYTMIFTFKLSMGKIIKNAFYFIILGIKRNFMALFGTIAFVLLNLLIFRLFMPIGIILPFILTIAIVDLIGVYASYPIIKKYMIDPQMTRKSGENEDFDEENAEYSEEITEEN